MFLNHDFLDPNLVLISNMQRKMGCPELVFEILNFEYNQLNEFLKENNENQASYEKNWLFEKKSKPELKIHHFVHKINWKLCPNDDKKKHSWRFFKRF